MYIYFKWFNDDTHTDPVQLHRANPLNIEKRTPLKHTRCNSEKGMKASPIMKNHTSLNQNHNLKIHKQQKSEN